MAKLYRNYLALLDKWPIDTTKQSRDLGQFIRDRLKESFKAGDLLKKEDEEKCTTTYKCLNRIADNYYCRLYERSYISSATGLTEEQCKIIISDDFLELLNSKERSFISKVFNRKS